MSDFKPSPSPDKPKHSLWGRIFKYCIPPVITVGLCYVLFHNEDIPAMIEYVSHNCDFRWIAASMLLTVASFLFRAMRWRIQLRASDIHPPLPVVTYSIVGTYAVNLVFPRLGEFWRSEYIARREGAHFTTVVGSMFADRLADMATVLLMLLMTLLLAGDAVTGFMVNYPALYDAVSSLLSSPVTYCALATLIICIIWFMRHTWAGGSFGERLQQWIKNLFVGVMSIFHMHGVWRWFLLSIGLWGSYFVSEMCCFMAFDFTRELLLTHGWIVVLVCFTLSSIAMGVPANGGIGPYQAALVFGLGFFVADLNTSQALGFANTVLGAQIVTIVACGIPTFIAIAIDHRKHPGKPVADKSKE